MDSISSQDRADDTEPAPAAPRTGPGDAAQAAFGKLQRDLARFNRHRLAPGLRSDDWQNELSAEFLARRLEGSFVESERRQVARRLGAVPDRPDAFVAWFDALRDSGPGQHDPLFPWLEARATRNQFAWFLSQEVAGEAGFDDLVALTQVKMPIRAKLEMARNYWDEMGQGNVKGMHGPMLDRLARGFGIAPTIDSTVPEALALGNLMAALAANRRYAFQSIGALGVIELTAPGRAACVNAGLKRLGVDAGERHYFALHACLDVRHAQTWLSEVLHSLVAEEPARAQPIAEGAMLRLWAGARCFERYRAHFKLAGGTARQLETNHAKAARRFSAVAPQAARP